jgi:phenylacetate-coenzyme A ligase PaaK-like adenylate-forming protein
MNEYVNKIKKELDDINKMSLDEFISMRNDKFRKMLLHHYNNPYNPAYRNLLKEHGIESEGDLPKSVDEINKLPIIDKEFLQQGDFANQPTVPKNEIYKIVETSGSTNQPKLIPHSLKGDLRLYGELITRSCVMNYFDLEGEGYWITHWIPGGKDTWASHAGLRMVVEVLGDKIIDESTQTLPAKHIENLLNNKKLTYSASAPNFYLTLISFAKKQNIDLSKSSIEKIMSGAAPITGDDREFVKKSFGVDKLVEFYISSEAFTMGVETEENSKYHLFLDEFVTEILDKYGNQIKENEKGDVTVTAFSMDAAPIIRYKLEDVAVFLGKSNHIDKFSMLTDIGRVNEAPFGDGLLPYDDISNIPRYMLSKGIPVMAIQIVKQKIERKEVPIIRIESPISDYKKVEEIAIEAFMSNSQMKNEIESGTIYKPKIELYELGKLRGGKFKVPLFVDETNSE